MVRDFVYDSRFYERSPEDIKEYINTVLEQLSQKK